MLKTRMTELLNIEHPIMQGGMMWISRAELTAAVSNAGGLGAMTALTFPDPKDLALEIRKTRRMTKNTFAVNVTLLPSFREIDYDGYIDVIIGEGVPVVETAGNNHFRCKTMSRLSNTSRGLRFCPTVDAPSKTPLRCYVWHNHFTVFGDGH